ncbi:hypothetical protein LCGC14_1830390 [marine sediment metagenome]|uniref:Uncharacterized protein n=1 Tax=marine sediment metagenome TaxID=412755 RepID=A0A0F9GGA6_9ZZZZ
MAHKVTLDYIRETYVWCKSCQQLLEHDRGYCPLFPNVEPVRGKKWTKCVCTVHTCYDNPLKLTYAGFALARVRSTSVSHYAFWYDGVTLCGRTPTVVGGVVKDPFRQGTCVQCIRGFLKRVNVYCD